MILQDTIKSHCLAGDTVFFFFFFFFLLLLLNKDESVCEQDWDWTNLTD